MITGVLRFAAAACFVTAGLSATAGELAAKTQAAHLSSTVTRDGLQLTVSLPETSAPRGSLVLVAFKIGNLTEAPFKFAASCIFGYTGPTVTSLQGQNRYPPAFPPLFKAPPCIKSHRYDVSAIPPGYQATVYRYVALRGRLVLFTMTQGILAGQRLNAGFRVTSDPVDMPLTPRTAHPVIHFGMSGARVVARVSGSEPSAKLHVQAQAVCRGGNVSRQTRWFVSGPVIPAPCAHPLRWRIAVGTVGRSVGVATYVAPAA